MCEGTYVYVCKSSVYIGILCTLVLGVLIGVLMVSNIFAVPNIKYYENNSFCTHTCTHAYVHTNLRGLVKGE